MAVKTVGAQGYDAVVTFNAATAASQAANNSSQNFGDVLNKAGDKIADNSFTNTKKAEAAKKPQQETQTSENKTSKERVENTDKVQKEQDVAKEQPADSEKKDDLTAKDVQTSGGTDEETVDEMTTEQIADALMQIIEQLKQLCGVSDEEILAVMERIDMSPAELFDANRLAQLLTVIGGEGDAISLVTNEDLYASLQTLTATAEDVSSQLLEDLGLTQEEFDAMLGQLSQTEGAFDEILASQEEAAEGVTGTVNDDAALAEEAPIVLVEETVKADDKKQPESQTVQNPFENTTETHQKDVVAQTQEKSQKPDHDAHEQKNNADGFGGQQNAQNFDNRLNEAQAAETTVRYTSENTESILRQLADMVKIVKNENLTQMELQLHPASLGTVNVSLVTKGGAVTAEFTTQNEAVRAAIESQVSQLMTNLEEQGVKVEAVEVSVASHEMERNLDENGRDEQSRKEQEEEQRVSGIRRNSINFNAFSDDEELMEELQGADDATRIAMELMAANGNSMDLMA